MLARLFLLMTVVPAVELYLLIALGQVLGPLPTVLLVVGTGGVGAFLAKREGLGVLRAIQREAERGIPPGRRLVEGLLVLVGGVLLVTPGVLTDLAGFLLILPPSRRWLAPRVQAWALRRFDVRVSTGGPPPPPAPGGASPGGLPFDHPVAPPDRGG